MPDKVLYLVIVEDEGKNVWMTPKQAERLTQRLKAAVAKGEIQEFQILNEEENAISYDDLLKDMEP